jgi:predicted XRE-type DNA-binding protein
MGDQIPHGAKRLTTRNVWLQLGFPDAEEHYLKAELVLRLSKAIKSLDLTQRVAARRIGATRPELSKILGGKFSEVSLERLMRFLTALGYHIVYADGRIRYRHEDIDGSIARSSCHPD